jgi:hypothetical protein
MIAVLVVAFAMTVWRSPDAVAVNLVVNATVLVLIVAIYKARFSQGRTAAWWLGFATVGWVHLIFWFCRRQLSGGTGFNIYFPTGLIFLWLEDALFGMPIRLDKVQEMNAMMARLLIFQSTTTMIAAFIGAWCFSTAARMAERRNGEGE